MLSKINDLTEASSQNALFLEEIFITSSKTLKKEPLLSQESAADCSGHCKSGSCITFT